MIIGTMTRNVQLSFQKDLVNPSIDDSATALRNIEYEDLLYRIN